VSHPALEAGFGTSRSDSGTGEEITIQKIMREFTISTSGNQ